MINSTFRADFPEFESTIKYPDSMLTFWGTLAENLILIDRWQDMKPFGVELFVAHQLVTASMNIKANEVDGLPGQFLGPANNKSVGEVSVGYDTNMSMELGAGHWNLTSYGKQFIRLARMFGAGAVQL